MAIRIRNKRTGEVKTIDESQLAAFGISPPATRAAGPTPPPPPPVTPPVGQAPQQGFLQRLTGALVPAGKKVAQLIGGGLGFGREAPAARASLVEAEEMNRRLMERAMAEPDPAEKRRLMQAAGTIGQDISGIAGEQVGAVRETLGLRPGEFEGRPLETPAQKIGAYAPYAGRAGAELGAWMFPTVGPGGPELGRAAARGALTGAGAGGLFGLSQEDTAGINDTLTNTINASLTGGVAGGAISGAFHIGSQVFKSVFQAFPRVLREVGFKIDEKTAQQTLERKAPGDFKKMIKWTDDIVAKADDKLQKLKPKKGVVGVEQIFPDPQNQQHFLDTGLDLIQELRKKGRFADATKLEQSTTNIIDGKASIQDVLFAKSKLDQSVQTTFKKTATQVAAQKAGARRVNADLLRDFVRNSPLSNKEVARLLDSQSFALTFKKAIDPAMRRYKSLLIPSRWEMLLLGGAAGIGGAVGGPVGIPAGVGLALGGSRAMKHPAFAKFLAGAGARGERLAPVTQRLQEFVTKGVARGATQ